MKAANCATIKLKEQQMVCQDVILQEFLSCKADEVSEFFAELPAAKQKQIIAKSLYYLLQTKGSL